MKPLKLPKTRIAVFSDGRTDAYYPQQKFLWFWCNLEDPQPTLTRAQGRIDAHLQGIKDRYYTVKMQKEEKMLAKQARRAKARNENWWFIDYPDRKPK